MSFTGYKEEQMTVARIKELTATGVTVIDMHDNKGASNSNLKYTVANFKDSKDADVNAYREYLGSEDYTKVAWYASLFRGLVKNKSEICPLSQTAVIDVNAGLRDQQCPAY